MKHDEQTAAAFAESWNRVDTGSPSVYSWEQWVDWLSPVSPESLRGERVLELGFGNGSLMFHAAASQPKELAGIELADTIARTRRNLAFVPEGVLALHRGDLTVVDLGRFDFVYCIGVLHHLEDPDAGFESVLRHTRAGGRFHCWVYAREGNALVRWFVEPLRRVASRLPWWLAKYIMALPLAVPFFLYAKAIASSSRRWSALGKLPLAAYCRWIARREFAFFHHVAFDQLVARRTRYLTRRDVEVWLSNPQIDQESTYLEHRNGNSWKLGGRKVQ